MKKTTVMTFVLLFASMVVSATCSSRLDPVALCRQLEQAGAAKGCAAYTPSGAAWMGALSAAEFVDPADDKQKGSVLVYADKEKFEKTKARERLRRDGGTGLRRRQHPSRCSAGQGSLRAERHKGCKHSRPHAPYQTTERVFPSHQRPRPHHEDG